MDETAKTKLFADLELDNPVELDASCTEPVVTELTGLVYSRSWGGTAKFNLTSDSMSDKTCKMLYGFPVSFEWLSFLVCHVYFPGVKKQKTSLTFGTPLSDFEQALALLHLIKTGEEVEDIAHHWGVTPRAMGHYLKKWSPK